MAVRSDSNRAEIDTDDALEEWIFTALTRVTSLLLIVVWLDGQPEVSALLGKLDPDRLLFWDEDAERAFSSIKN